MQKRFKICHLTTVHSYNDVRIFLKECCSLASAGFETHLIVPGAKDEVVNGVHLHGIPKNVNSRVSRMTKVVWAAYKKARAIDSDLYHFHDPELLPVGLILKFYGKKVIYDIHEDVPRDILTKEWIPGIIRKQISSIFEFFENWAVKRINCAVGATPFITNRFLSLGIKAVNINNYPIIKEFYAQHTNWGKKEQAICYIGTIERARGTVEMVKALGKTNAKLLLAGKYSPEDHRNEVIHLDEWKQVEELGQINRDQVAHTLARSMAGLVLFHPGPNHNDAQPNKMFEYMSIGIPVISSNFPLWEKIIEGHNCGICVEPLNTAAIADAIQWVMDHPVEAENMGKNGLKAVKEKYNWETESKKLITLYGEVLT